jgi:hypothetical protein
MQVQQDILFLRLLKGTWFDISMNSEKTEGVMPAEKNGRLPGTAK